jgi:biotin transport system substrate-specific component|tara:strand:+ start:280 stop:837 length:558 start_codon:yes stop_codon:yes gene_type:complete
MKMELVKIVENKKILRFLIIAFLGSIALAISSKIKIPFYPVPMTMQTFVVLFLGISFGYKIGLASVSLYLFEGIIGLPVFSNSPEKGVGLVYFMGPTMGYLIGFLLAVFFAGYLNFKSNYLTIFIKLIFSVSVIYILGLLWLGSLIGWDKPIFELGAKPFLLAELFKISLLTLITKKIVGLRKFI